MFQPEPACNCHACTSTRDYDAQERARKRQEAERAYDNPAALIGAALLSR